MNVYIDRAGDLLQLAQQFLGKLVVGIDVLAGELNINRRL